MNDCRFGVSPVNYPDPDPDPVCVFMYLRYCKLRKEQESCKFNPLAYCLFPLPFTMGIRIAHSVARFSHDNQSS